MSNEIIEKCRQALWDHHCPGIRRTDIDDEFYRDSVKVIIRALSEPPKGYNKIVYHGEYADDVWREMIDEILRN